MVAVSPKDHIEITLAQKGIPITADTPLGAAINGPFSISSFFPKEGDVEAYEKNAFDRSVLGGLYPRFGRGSFIQQIEEQARAITGAKHVVVLPNEAAALACVDFVSTAFPKLSWARNVRDYPGTEFKIICCDNAAVYKKALEFWQHTGEIVTGRSVLPNLDCDLPADYRGKQYTQAERTHYAEKLAGIVSNVYRLSSSQGIFIANTGMSAIYHAFRAVDSLPQNQNEGTYLQFGFPYTDTYKILEKWGGKAEMLSSFSDADYERVEELAASGKLKAVFTEVPCNPLIVTPDLKRLSGILRKYKVPLVVDDTLGTPHNLEVLPHADIVVHSLTKFFSGQANVMGGALLVNQHGPLSAALTSAATKTDFSTIAAADLKVLCSNSNGFPERMRAINRNAETIVAMLRDHPAVDWVSYPQGNRTQASYEALRREDGGYGGMLTFSLKDPERTDEFMRNLNLWKGPSLGFERAIVTLYTLFAHFDELKFAAAHGIGARDIRVSVGRDKQDVHRFKEALGTVS